MDIITLTSEVKETIDLDKMSPDELRKVVKSLWHQVQSLSSKVDTERWRHTSIGGTTYFGSSLTSAQ